MTVPPEHRPHSVGKLYYPELFEAMSEPIVHPAFAQEHIDWVLAERERRWDAIDPDRHTRANEAALAAHFGVPVDVLFGRSDLFPEDDPRRAERETELARLHARIRNTTRRMGDELIRRQLELLTTPNPWGTKGEPMSKESSDHTASIAGRALRGQRITAAEQRALAASVLVQHEAEKAAKRRRRPKRKAPKRKRAAKAAEK